MVSSGVGRSGLDFICTTLSVKRLFLVYPFSLDAEEDDPNSGDHGSDEDDDDDIVKDTTTTTTTLLMITMSPTTHQLIRSCEDNDNMRKQTH